jgi:hypothetical protein
MKSKIKFINCHFDIFNQIILTLITKLNHINGIKWSASLLISIFGCVQNKFRNNPYVTCPVDSLTLFIRYSMNNFIEVKFFMGGS